MNTHFTQAIRLYGPLMLIVLVLLASCAERETITPPDDPLPFPTYQDDDTTATCSNTCPYANDGDCDDGGPGSDYDLCPCNTDCADCGDRTNGCGGGSGSSTGEATLWTQEDLLCGYISVSVGGDNQEISSYYSNGPPDCGASGCANYTLAPGTYSYSASCTGYSWNGSFTIQSGGCTTIQISH